MGILLDYFIGHDTRPPSREKSLDEFARRIRDRLMWTLLEWSLGDPNRVFRKTDLSQLNAYILFVVRDAGSISIGDVGRKLGQEKSVITKSLGRLIEKGYIRKEKDKTDGRRHLLSLTDEGNRVFDELDAISIDRYTDWLKHVPAEDRKKVLEAVVTLDNAMSLRRTESTGSDGGK